MKHMKLLLLGLLTLAVIPYFGIVPASAHVSAQNQSTALERGYRTGYSDGYNAGFNDVSNKAPRDYQNKEDFQRAERSYNEVWGPVEDFRDGYQQGFESGYNAGFDRQSFNSNIPSSLKRRRPNEVQTTDVQTGSQQPDSQQPSQAPASAGIPNQENQDQPAVNASVPASLPRNSVMLVELTTSISTETTQRGDRFQARVVEPREFDGATVEGRVTAVKRPGKVKGVAELQLIFETMRLPDGRVTSFSADIIEVVQMGGGDGVATVDPEGGVRGKSSTKNDVSKVGAATGIGAIIGAIAGGGKGAAIGAAIGGGVGTGAVLNDRGKDIRLDQGQQLRIRTASDTNIALNR